MRKIPTTSEKVNTNKYSIKFKNRKTINCKNLLNKSKINVNIDDFKFQSLFKNKKPNTKHNRIFSSS